jgi:tRNA A-37 threonylcarbamoyl transferase component Bud32
MTESTWHFLSVFGISIAALCAALIGLGLLFVGIFAFRHFRQKKQVSTPLPQPPLAPPPTVAATVMLPKCPQCHMPLAPNTPEGLCPACLAKVALGSEPAAPAATINVNPLAEAAPPTRVAPDPAQLASQFPQLEIIELLGMGGMGMVYKARQPRLDRIVALKILPVESQQHPSFAERFNREAKALAKLNHPGIVNVYDFGQTSQYYFFIMEFVDGMNLRQLLNTEKVTPRQALELVVQICTALQYAHDEGVVHRDIKPENILLNKKGQVKIADFGLAKLLGTAPDTALTMSQAAMGTLNYMAPEQRQNAQGVDHRADIYSLGVVFYEMLTGEVPMGRFEAPSKRVQVDVRLDEVVLRALEREPARRYQQVSEVKSNVETITSTPSPTSIPSGTPTAPRIAESLLNREYQLRIGYCLRRGWVLVKSDFWPTVGVTALVLTLLEIATVTLDDLGEAAKGTSLGFAVIQCLATGPMLAGLTFYFLKKIRREPATVETAFAGFSKRFLHLFLANFLISVLVALGIVFLFLPGIYLMVAWAFALTLIVDKGLDFWPAMELSRKTIHKHWWKMLLFLVVLGTLWLAGVLCFVVGFLVAVPVTIAALMYAYEDIFGNRAPVNAIAGQPKLAGEAKVSKETITSTPPKAPAVPPQASNPQRRPGFLASLLKPSRLWVLAVVVGVFTGFAPEWAYTTRYWGVWATDDPNTPVQVIKVASDSPAEQTGFRVGDVVKDHTNFASFSKSWDKVKEGEQQTFTVRRNGQDVVLEATAGQNQIAAVWYANLWYPIAGALFILVGIIVFATSPVAPPPLWRSVLVAIAGLGIAIGFAIAVAGDGVFPRFAVFERWIFVPTKNDWCGLQGLFGLAAAVLVTVLGAGEIRQRLRKPTPQSGSAT